MYKLAMLLLVVLLVGCVEDAGLGYGDVEDIGVEYTHTHYPQDRFAGYAYEQYTGAYTAGSSVYIPCAGRYLIDGVECRSEYTGMEREIRERRCFGCGSSFEAEVYYYNYRPRVTSLRLIRECDLEERDVSFTVFEKMGGHIIP